MSAKDYSDVNRLALGHITHEQLAQKLLQQTRSSEELMSVLRAGHDRIQYFLCGKPATEDAIAVELGTVENTSAVEHAERVRVFEQNQLTDKVQTLQVEVNVLTGNLTNAEQNLSTANASVLQLTEQLAQEQANSESIAAEFEKTKADLTAAYMGKHIAEEETKLVQAKLDDLMENYEIVDGDDDAEEENEKSLADAADTTNEGYYVPTKPELLEIALRHGFRVRQQGDGKEDLNDYVYATIYDGIKLSQTKTQ